MDFVERVGRRRPGGGNDPGSYRPGDVTRLLGLQGLLTHEQFRRLALLASDLGPAWPTEPSPGRWLSLDTKAVLRICTLIDLCGGPTAMEPGRRLMRLRPVREACLGLRAAPFSIADPLLEVQLFRVGSRVLALHQRSLIDPTTGQLGLVVELPVSETRERWRRATRPSDA